MDSVIRTPAIPPMSAEAIGKVAALEAETLKLPQLRLVTSHVLHGGMYARTILVPAGALITGALIKVPTLLIAQGEAVVYVGGGSLELSGYNVLPASAGRKQAFLARSDLWLTMVFPTDAMTVEEAEAHFTDEVDRLGSHGGDNIVLITGE